MSWSQNESREIRMIHVLTQCSPRLNVRQRNGANCAEFARLYLTLNELRKICVIHCSFGSLPGPEKVPLLLRIAQNLHHSRVL